MVTSSNINCAHDKQRNCRPIKNGVKLVVVQWQKFGSRFLLHLRPLANSAMMSTLSVKMRRRGRGLATCPHAEAKKMKSLTLHTHGSLNFCSSSSSMSKNKIDANNGASSFTGPDYY